MASIHNADRKLRIGILTRDIEGLDNWEYVILQEILNHPNLELALFIKDGREDIKSLSYRLKKNVFTSKFVSNIMFQLQTRLESLVFKPKHTVDAHEIIEKTKDIDTISLCPERKGYLDIFSKEDAKRVKDYNLDIILRHEFNIIHGDILNAARYGIWSFHHADNSINRGGPAGFWEIVNKEPCVGATLQQLTPELDGGFIIDKGWFNVHWSFAKTNNDLLEKSVVILFKNINKLLRDGDIKTKKSLTYYNRLYRHPGLWNMLKYIIIFYSSAFTRVVNALFPIKRPNCWALFFDKGNFLESALFRTKPIEMPKGVFWADPFLFKHNEQLYVFFENFSYKTKRGKISVGRIVERAKGEFVIVDAKDALDLPYHLSYPQVVEEDGEIYLIPESYEDKKLEVFRCVQFPDKWELYSTAFEGEEVVDTTYFCDENGDRWLFLNKGWTHEAELHIYKIDNLKLENIIPHNNNPVIIDCRKGRNGGTIFKYEDEYYRPSQINVHGIYGKGLQITKIKKLTLDEFEDENIISIEPNFREDLMGIHHLHQLENNFIFDVCFKKL